MSMEKGLAHGIIRGYPMWPIHQIEVAVASSTNFKNVIKLLGSNPSKKTYQQLKASIGDHKLNLDHFGPKATKDLDDLINRRSATIKRTAIKISASRRTDKDVPRWILEDCRKADKRKGFYNDLTKNFITRLIRKGCSYCGETSLRMTLDRIDNNQGHTKDNVVPACLRCNYMRRDVPYEAWKFITPAIREAKLQGLFGTWTGRCK